ncbi:MAG: AAA family ATPase [archaeon]|nr:AAA family ATPase [archaeon]
MFQIAFYGKGGIGKSTISANVSYNLSKTGKKILQVGCDPKHDSTRLLLNGNSQTTVLEYMRSTPKEKRKLQDVVVEGSNGIDCIEAGGPEPGVGCAGRGILTTFDFLHSEGIDNKGYDYKIYDVLGDVVCGGFAVPLRQDYADAVYIVTSGEFMSLYAANNILKGLVNYDDGRPRVGGLILNCRGLPGEKDYVKNFADAVGLPIITKIPRHPKFMEAEAQKKTVSELFPDSEPAVALKVVVDEIEKVTIDPSKLNHPHPLDDVGMDLVAKGQRVSPANRLVYNRVRNPSGDAYALVTCAFGGAIAFLSRIRGIHTIIHGTPSCGYIMANFTDAYNIRRSYYDKTDSIWSRMSCTNLNDSESVFGGRRKLEKLIEDRISKGDRYIFVVSTCVAGIIGDNVDSICAEMSKKHPDVKIYPVKADGVVNGSTLVGRDIVIESILDLVDHYEEKDEHLIDIIGDYKAMDDFHAYRDKEIERMMELAGFRINTAYPEWTDVNELKKMGKAKYAVKAMLGGNTLITSQTICGRLGITLMKNTLPRGRSSVMAWLDEVQELTGRDMTSAKQTLLDEYYTEINKIKKRTSGKKVVVCTEPIYPFEWFFELLEDLEIEGAEKMENTYQVCTSGADACKGKVPHRSVMMQEAVDRHHPDAVLSTSRADMKLDVRAAFIEFPGCGITGMLEYARKLGYLFDSPLREEWKVVE